MTDSYPIFTTYSYPIFVTHAGVSYSEVGAALGAQLMLQGGRCPICRNWLDLTRAEVDTEDDGTPTGILCAACSITLDNCGNDPDRVRGKAGWNAFHGDTRRIQRAADYLTTFGSTRLWD